MAAEAQVVALQANFCQVQLRWPGPSGIDRLLCTRRTRLGKRGQQICVGDWVTVEAIDWGQRRGAIGGLGDRLSLLERPAVANCSRIVVVVALTQPEPDPLQLTRFLITAERSGQLVEVVFSKADLVPPGEAQRWITRLDGWGYGALSLSTHTGSGLAELEARLSKPGLSVLCGPSGVGKSSLLNALIPALQLRVAAVSGRLQRGRHTTRHVELFPLAEGALVADTPGFNRPELPGDPQQLPLLFPEIRRALAAGGCRFSNCLHQGDPGCAVGEGWDRFPLYTQCLAEISGPAETGQERTFTGLQRGPDSRRRQRQRLLEELARDGVSASADERGSADLIPPDPAG
jgi:ribosome biogenesis GTPase